MDIDPVGGGPDPSPGHTSDLSQKWTALGRLSPQRPAAHGVLYVNILPCEYPALALSASQALAFQL